MSHNKSVSGKIVLGLSVIMIITLLAYFVVLCNPLFVAKKVFWSIYVLFNIRLCHNKVLKIHKIKLHVQCEANSFALNYMYRAEELFLCQHFHQLLQI